MWRHVGHPPAKRPFLGKRARGEGTIVGLGKGKASELRTVPCSLYDSLFIGSVHCRETVTGAQMLHRLVMDASLNGRAGVAKVILTAASPDDTVRLRQVGHALPGMRVTRDALMRPRFCPSFCAGTTVPRLCWTFPQSCDVSLC